jgi:serine/threonine protein kinase
LLQIANALVTLHSYDLAHLDIKPENILIRGNYAVLADFATVYKVKGIKKVEKRLGTLEYCAPEMLDFLITTKSDVYSFTKTIFVALQGHFPNVNAIDGSYGEQLSELYLSGLMEDPEDRCSIGDVYKKLYYISIK